MNKKALATTTLLVICLCPILSQAQWSGKKDNKPVDELELMDEHELATEASYVCLHGALTGQFWNKDKRVEKFFYEWSEALEYLETIKRVARKKHGGEAPPWPQQMIQVVSDNAESSDCFSISHGVLNEHIEPLNKNKEKKGQKKQAK